MFSSPIATLIRGNTIKAVSKPDSLNSTVDTDDTLNSTYQEDDCSLNSSYNEDKINDDEDYSNEVIINSEDDRDEVISSSNNNDEDDNTTSDENGNNGDNALSIITYINSITTVEEEIEFRRECRDTYAEPLIYIQENEFRNFMKTFYRTIYKRKKECEELRTVKYPDTIGKYYNELVDENYDGSHENDKISSEDFWQRYFYRCDMERIEKERKKNEEELKKSKEIEEKKKKINNRPKLAEQNEFVKSVRKLFAMQ